MHHHDHDVVNEHTTTRDRQSHMSTEIEKKSLEAHVELCAERYAKLNEKLNDVDSRLDKLENHVDARLSTLEQHVLDIRDLIGKSKESNTGMLFSIGLTVFAALLGGILTFIFKR